MANRKTAPVDEPATAPAGEPATAPVDEPATAPVAEKPLYDVPLYDVKIEDIAWEASPQVREEIDEETVARYAELLADGVKFPPVVMYRDIGKRAPFLLVDGFHRARAYEELGRDVIPARVYPGTAEQAQWYALGANREHGLRLGALDVRRAVELALKRKPLPSQRLIARQVGCSQSYVGSIRREQVSAGVHLSESTVGADGKSYRASRKSRKASPSRQSEAPPASSSTPPAAPAAEASGPVEPAGEESPPLFPPMPEPETTPATPASEPAGDAAPPVQTAASRPGQIRPDSNRIVGTMADSVAHLGGQDYLIDFDKLDRDQAARWADEFVTGIRYLETLVERLRAVSSSKA